jgi:hypothetical protein
VLRKSQQDKNNDLELYSEILAWAQINSVSQDPYLVELLEVIDSGSGIEGIANLQPYEVLPKPVHKQLERRLNLANTLSILRNVLVFFPVALTWIAVSKSTTAFAAYTEANSSAVVNFLEFWQNGYGVLAKDWTIGHVALLDFSIIMIVIVLTLTTAFMNKRRIATLKKLNANSNTERLQLAIKINKYITSHQKMDAPTVSTTIATTSRQLLETAKELTKTAKSFQREQKDIPTNKLILKEIKRIKGVK